MKTTGLVNNYVAALSLSQHHADTGDGPLLRRFVGRRDDDAFAELLRRHGPMVLGLSRRVVGDRHLAEDVFQATFLALARKAHSVRRPESVAAWLHGVAFHLSLRARKVGARRRQEEARVPTGRAGRDPLDELTARELLAVLDEEIQALPPHFRLPLILCGMEGLSHDEAARRLGWSPGSIKGRLERGRQRLRLRFQKRGLTLPAALAGTVLLGELVAAVPPALAEAAHRVAQTGVASQRVSALVEHTGRAGSSIRMKTTATLLVGIGVLAIGLGWWNGPLTGPLVALPDDPPATKRQDPPADPLPGGAVQRLGTLQRRAVGAHLALSAEGKRIVGVRGGLCVQVWDAQTGLLKERRELKASPWTVTVLSPHGTLLATDDMMNRALHVWDVQTGKELHEFRLHGLKEGEGGGSPATGPIGLHAAAFSPDERIVAAVLRAGKQAFLRSWDLNTGKQILDKELADAGWVDFLTFTPDAKRLLLSDQSGLCAYDARSGERQWQVREMPAPTWFAITPDGKILARGNGILAWDLATGKPTPFENQPPESWDGPLAVTPDGRTLLVGGTAGVLVWDLAQGKEMRTLLGAGEQMVLAPDARTVLTNNGSLQRWDLATGKPMYPDTFEQGHVGEVVSVAFSADGKRLASGSADGSVRLWDTVTGRPLHVWRGHEARRAIRLVRWLKAGVSAVDISPDGHQVVSAGSDERLCVWDAGTGKRVHLITLPEPAGGEANRRITVLRLRAGDGQVVALFGAELFSAPVGGPIPDSRPKLATWDLKTGALLHSIPTDGSGAVLSASGDSLVADGVVTDPVTGREVARLDKTKELWPVPPYAISPDGLLVASGLAKSGTDNGVEYQGPAGGAVWEVRSGKRVARFTTESWLGGLSFHPGGRHVAVNDLDGIQIVDVTTDAVVAKFTMPEKIRAGTTPGSYASCVAFTPDGRRMATGHPDGSILLWEVKLPTQRPEPLGGDEIDALWQDLASPDAARAWRAVWRLGESADAALALIGKHVRPVRPAPASTTGPLLADLDSDSFDRREDAAEALRKLGILAEPALRGQLDRKVSLEAKRRVRKLLIEITEAPQPTTPETLRQLRAVAVLAQVNSPGTRHLLEDLATGVRPAPLTRAARAALNR
jgi:RNA polymerase sigma factor (sigma-70 family)